MTPASWKSALRAATKVAFATSLAGCGGAVVVAPLDESEDETTAETGTDPEPVPTPEPEPERAVCAEPVAGWELYDGPTFDCCVEAVAARLTEGPLAFGTVEDPEIEGCCAQLVTPNYDALWSGQPLAYDAPADVIAGCCDLRHGNAGCTPWGPPTPPAMDPGDLTPWLAQLGGVA